MIKENYNDLMPLVALAPVAIAIDTTTVGIAIDLANYESATFILSTGAVSAGTVTLLLEESDDNFSTSNVVADADMVPVNVSGTLYRTGQEAASIISTANTSRALGYIGTKRYVRLSAVSATSANLVAAGLFIGGGKVLPVYGLGAEA